MTAGSGGTASGGAGSGGARRRWRKRWVTTPCRRRVRFASCARKWEEITPKGVATSDALTLDPFTAGTLWFGADPIGGGTPGLGGVFKSTDCGASWKHMNSGTNGTQVDNAHIWSMAVDFVVPGVIYVVGAYGPQGLWKSTNGGVDWIQLFPPNSEFAKTVANNWASSVSIDPDRSLAPRGRHPRQLLGRVRSHLRRRVHGRRSHVATLQDSFLTSWAEQTGPYIIDASTFVFASVFDGTWLTTDHGATWNKVSGIGGSCAGEFTHRPVWKSGGTFYLPACNADGIITSPDGRSWAPLAGVPGGGYPLGFAIGGGNFYVGHFNDWNYYSASIAAPRTWTKMPAPAGAGSGKQGPVFLEYDDAHHLLYSSNFTGGVWRIVTP